MEAESYWKHQEIVGVVCQGRLGLGHYSDKRWSRADTRARRGLVVQRVREAAEEDRQVKAIGLASQGRWTQWDQAQERSLSWKELWQTDQGKLSFLLRSVTDLLPTPRNIKIWGGEEDPSCNQCGAAFCTLNHILAGCPRALAEGRYRWRHDKVLTEIAKWVEQQRVKANNKQAYPPQSTTFVREGDKAHKTGMGAKNPPSTLQRAFDWELRVDLKKKLVFPQDVAVTSLRPDMVLLSRSTKSIIIAELTVPWEERLATSHQLKKAKYQDLVDEATLKGWHATSYPIEVGCRGFPAKSVRYFLQKMGLEPKQLKKATRGIAAAAESSSRWLWLKRAHSWNPSAGEVFRLRGETPETLRSLLMMWKGSNNVDASRNTILEEVLHHHSKSKCKEQSQQRRAPKLTQSDISKFVKDVHQSVEEDQGQEANHSAPDLPAQPTQSTGRVGEPESQKDFERKPRLNLPPTADCRWAQLDDDINTILENTLKGDAAKKIKIMVDIVYQACHDTFGEKEGKTPRPPAGPSRRQRQIKELREELKTLKRRWREASDEERAALNEISREMRKRLIQLRSAETTREKQREKRRKRKAFFNNPFQFTADLLGKPKGGTLSCAKEEIEDSVAAAHGDSSRSIPLDGRLGLGHYSDKRWSRADTRARRGLVVQRVREAAEEDRQVKAIGLASQGRWTQWDQAQERSLSWKELWQTDQGKLSFLLRSQRVKANNKQAYPPQSTTFVREGDKAHKTGMGAKNPPSTLQRAFDWELRVDLKKKLVFPQDVAVTSLRPDMVLLSRSTKSIIIAELTVPWEERLATSHQLKKAKYQDLVDEATLKGWHATSYPIEVGCRGFPAKSVRYFLQKMGLEPKQLKKATRGIAAAAESSSRWLWLKRAHSWNPSAGEVFRLRGETPETLRSLLMMWKGSNNVDASRNTILEEVLHHHMNVMFLSLSVTLNASLHLFFSSISAFHRPALQQTRETE
ncbi:unnamed protein product [Leuciscus chuanchicus]